MSFDRLLQVRKEFESRSPIRPAIFLEPTKQQKARHKLVVSGHLDKQEVCRCGYDQTCVALICDHCGRERAHAAVLIIERNDAGVVTTFWYRHCRCGAKKWMYPCEKRIVKKIA